MKIHHYKCTYCHTLFEYPVNIEGQGSSASLFFMFDVQATNRARRKAEKDLKRKLANSIAPLPCPSCGEYQPEMLKTLAINQVPFNYHFWAAFWPFYVLIFAISLVIASIKYFEDIGLMIWIYFSIPPLLLMIPLLHYGFVFIMRLRFDYHHIPLELRLNISKSACDEMNHLR